MDVIRLQFGFNLKSVTFVAFSIFLRRIFIGNVSLTSSPHKVYKITGRITIGGLIVKIAQLAKGNKGKQEQSYWLKRVFEHFEAKYA